MKREIKNFDNLLDKNIKNSLRKNTSDVFTENLMKQINLSKQFALEDKKESKVLIYLTGGISLFFVSFLVLISYLYIDAPASEKSNSIFDNFSTLIQQNILLFYNKLATSFSIEYLVIFLMIIGLIAMSNFTDKLFLRKR